MSKGVIVVGGGPSAPDHYEFIRTAGMKVVAASTMLLPLQRAGIRVDVTCVIDPGVVMALHFRGAMTEGLLVHHADVIRQIVIDWKGLKVRVDTLPGPSVINLCVETALGMGADELHLVGCDFAYRGKQSHAEGVVTAFEVTSNITVEGWKTDWDLVTFRNELRDQLEGVPYVRHGDGLPL